jgi:hypothetical protein
MLNTIKNIIKEKKVFQEAADFILEDEALDDSIILNEDDSYPEEDAEDERKPEKNHDDESKKEDLMDISMDDLCNRCETLPKPVGSQTGEPAEVGDDILLSTEIDLNTNTSIDTLPTPPLNAADAVEGEVDTSKVDSGFDDTSLLDTPIDDEGSDKLAEESTITEAINIGEEPADDKASEEKPEEKEEEKTSDESQDEGSDESAEEEPKKEDNPVTAAVRDKVSEMNTEDDVNPDSNGKDALFKKLSNLTKGIEDIKTSLLKH